MRGHGLFTIRNGVTACMMVAALSLLVVQAIGPVQAIIVAAAILWGRRRVEPALRPVIWDSLAMAALIFFPLDLFLFSRSLISSALRLLSFVVVYRCSNMSGRRELRQAIALSFVQILAAAASTTEAYFGILLAFYLSMTIWTLMAMASARDDAPPAARRPPPGRPALLMTTATVALGSVLFFVIPHLGTGYLQQAMSLRGSAESLSGFSDRIELGSISRIKKSRAIVMRVRIVSASWFLNRDAPLRWRGLALDTFDGRNWSVSSSETEWLGMDQDGWFALEQPASARHPEMVSEISMEPTLTGLLFVPPGARRLSSEDLPVIGLDAGGSIHLQAPMLRRFGYRVVSPDPDTAPASSALPSTSGAGRGDLLRYLTLPRVDPRIEALAREVTAKAETDFEKARRIEDHLRSHYGYTLDVNDAGVSDPLAHFLIEKNPGHCEYFATSMAVMLRYLGIPSRVINGFASGEWSGLTGTFIVRQSDAHSWVEAWLPGRGWVTFDPTPSDTAEEGEAGLLSPVRRGLARAELMWDTWVIGLDLLDQQSLVATVVDAARVTGAAARGALASVASPLGWSLTAAVCSLLALAAGAAARARWRARRGRRPGAAPASPATELLRLFEARWASVGLRRRPDQTPMEFATEIERRALDTPGAAVALMREYYRARYGPAAPAPEATGR